MPQWQKGGALMPVNFISEITGFYRYVRSNHLSNNAQVLWFHMFCLWNEAGFPDWLQVDGVRMMGMIGVNSRSSLDRTRNELIASGLLVQKSGGHRKPCKYQMARLGNSLKASDPPKPEPKTTADCATTHQTSRQTGHQTSHQTGPETGHLYKLNDTKPSTSKKTAYGEFGNVTLTDAELAKLKSDCPDAWDAWIKRLSIGKQMKGYVYTSDYAAILSWIQNQDNEDRDKAYQELLDEL
ncbi:hypothetical protein GH808_05685 [Acetobacterium fimetarium]|uniref:Helix-turn-helix domain-containing protein n=1 Tax=Acetobacterium fimetarium TaxID=52691 RepID=A0ABR6WTM1_9FIRM|nr:hypothetical protein [Acetobacterium fimetarium]MBC3803927.1 hypothetical protein [Acetobacterium fimetarium]